MIKNQIKDKVQKGFTIIEVMIVLAIAGLILVVVLIAIPQLQRNQRNETRRSIASRIVAEISAYAGNNNGKIPTAEPKTSTAIFTGDQFGTPLMDVGFMNRYLGCRSTTTECDVNIIDPSSGFPVGTRDDGVNRCVRFGGADGVEPRPEAGCLMYRVGTKCDGETAIASTGPGFSGASRDFSFMIRLEGGAVFCQDND